MTAVRARLIGPSRLFLIVSMILFFLAALVAGGQLKLPAPAEALALFAFGFWVGSGAVE